MGRKSIVGRLPVVYDPARRGFAVENSAEFVKTQIRQKLDELAHGKPLREEYGLEYDFLELPVAAVPILRNAYRLVHIVELLDNDRCTVKASMGSSSFSTAQMTAFIDGIFDRLAEMGVNDPNVTAYWQEWQEVPK